MNDIKQIEGITCEVAEHEKFNATKALVYNQSSDNSAYFKKGLMEKFSISSVEKAEWIQTRDLRVYRELPFKNHPRLHLDIR